MYERGSAALLDEPDLGLEPRERVAGRATLTARLPPSARSIARAVAAEMRGPAPAPTLAGTLYRSAVPALGGGSFLDEILDAPGPRLDRDGRGDVTAGAEAHVDRALQGGGHALPAPLRARFEQSLGADLGGVRIHDDAASATAAAAVGARAYALGQDVFMGAGQYRPETDDGALLLAHEVAHTVQQRGGAAQPQYKLEVSSPGDASEVEADAAAHAMVAGAPFAVGGALAGAARAIHRWADERGANTVLAAIARADRAGIQRIILAIETARSNNTPGVALDDRNVTVAIADLHDLERRARARFDEVRGEGGREERGEGGREERGGGAPAQAEAAPAPAAQSGGGPGHAAPANDGHAGRIGVQTRERFRQELDLMDSNGRVFAGGWLKLRSIRVRIEAYEDQNPIATPANGDRIQVTGQHTRRGGSSSTGAQVELPPFRRDEWHQVVGGVQGRTNFALSAAIAREGGVMTGNIGMGTVQVRQQHIPLVNELSFECPIRIFEVARTRSGGQEIRLLEARPTFHAGPFQFHGVGPMVRVSIEVAIGPNRDKFLAELVRLGIRSAVTEAAAAATAATGEGAAATAATAATGEAATATTATAATGEAATATAATGEAATATAATGEAATATAATGEAATATAATGEVAATGSGMTMGGVMIAGGFILGGIATIAATFASLTEGDAYFRHASESQQRFYQMCASYSRVMRGLPSYGSAEGQHDAEATLARIARDQNVTVAVVQQHAAQLGGAHFYRQAYDHGQARLRAAMRAATERVTGVGPADADNRVDALATGGDLYNRYQGRWPLD